MSSQAEYRPTRTSPRPTGTSRCAAGSSSAGSSKAARLPAGRSSWGVASSRAPGSGFGTGARPDVSPSRLGTVAGRDARQRGGYTLRLRAMDANGNVGEDRAFFRSLRDRIARTRIPEGARHLGRGVAHARQPRGAAREEIVLATSDGLLHVLDGKTGRDVRAGPSGCARPATRVVSKAIGPVRRGFLGTPAVGDVAGDAKPEIVVDRPRRARLRVGPPRPARSAASRVRSGSAGPLRTGDYDAAIYASPALVDLDRDGKLDIVVGRGRPADLCLEGRRELRPRLASARARRRQRQDEDPLLARDRRPRRRRLARRRRGHRRGVRLDPRDHRPRLRVLRRREAAARLAGQARRACGRRIPLAGEGVPDFAVARRRGWRRPDEVAVAAFTGQPELYRGDGTRIGGPPASRSALQHGPPRSALARKRPGGPRARRQRRPLGAPGAADRCGFFSGLVDARLVARAALAVREAPVRTPPRRVGRALGRLAGRLPACRSRAGRSSRPGRCGRRRRRRRRGHRRLERLPAARLPRGWHASRRAGRSRPAAGCSPRRPWATWTATGGYEVVAVTREGYLFAWDTPTKATTPAGMALVPPRRLEHRALSVDFYVPVRRSIALRTFRPLEKRFETYVPDEAPQRSGSRRTGR